MNYNSTLKTIAITCTKTFALACILSSNAAMAQVHVVGPEEIKIGKDQAVNAQPGQVEVVDILGSVYMRFSNTFTLSESQIKRIIGLHRGEALTTLLSGLLSESQIRRINGLHRGEAHTTLLLGSLSESQIKRIIGLHRGEDLTTLLSGSLSESQIKRINGLHKL